MRHPCAAPSKAWGPSGLGFSFVASGINPDSPYRRTATALPPTTNSSLRLHHGLLAIWSEPGAKVVISDNSSPFRRTRNDKRSVLVERLSAFTTLARVSETALIFLTTSCIKARSSWSALARQNRSFLVQAKRRDVSSWPRTIARAARSRLKWYY